MILEGDFWSGLQAKIHERRITMAGGILAGSYTTMEAYKSAVGYLHALDDIESDAKDLLAVPKPQWKEEEAA